MSMEGTLSEDEKKFLLELLNKEESRLTGWLEKVRAGHNLDKIGRKLNLTRGLRSKLCG